MDYISAAKELLESVEPELFEEPEVQTIQYAQALALVSIAESLEKLIEEE